MLDLPSQTLTSVVLYSWSPRQETPFHVQLSALGEAASPRYSVSLSARLWALLDRFEACREVAGAEISAMLNPEFSAAQKLGIHTPR